MRHWRTRLSFASGCVLLIGIVCVSYLIVAVLGQDRYGAMVWRSAGLAATVAGAGALGALIISSRWRDPRSSVAAVFGAMIMRMGLPLGTGVYIQSRGGPLAEAGFFAMVLVFYLVCLIAETLIWLSIKHSPPPMEGATNG